MSVTMQRIVVAVSFAASLAGCAAGGRPVATDWAGFFAQSNSIREECRKKNATAVGTETCTTEQLRSLNPAKASSADVLEAHTAKRLQAAARLDRGEIGREAFDRLVAGANSEASVELSRRDRLASAERMQSNFETTSTESESTRQIKMLPRPPSR
jgi:hypothetical protein